MVNLKELPFKLTRAILTRPGILAYCHDTRTEFTDLRPLSSYVRGYHRVIAVPGIVTHLALLLFKRGR
jgi:hypothetical protein